MGCSRLGCCACPVRRVAAYPISCRCASASLVSTAGVDQVGSDHDSYAAEHFWVDHDVEVYGLGVHVRERLRQATPMGVAERRRDPGGGEQPLVARRQHLLIVQEPAGQASVTSHDDLVQQVLGDLADLATEHVGEQGAFGLNGGGGVRQRLAQLWLGSDDAPEPEQLVLHLVQLSCVIRRGRQRGDGDLFDAVGNVTTARPALAGGRLEHVESRLADLTTEQGLEQVVLALHRHRRLGQSTSQGRLVVEHADHREELLTQT